MFEYVWKEFCIKMKQDNLCDSDFAEDMRSLLHPLLCGSDAAQRREKFLASPYEIYEGNAKCSVLLHCPDDDYRFDFSIIKDEWRLLFIECITLPVHDIAVLPYKDFRALPEKEAEIRGEKEAIWKNRASESGWTLQFIYHDEDTELVFTNFF